MSVAMHLKTANGYYAQATNGGGGEVSAKGPWPREWETFTLRSASGDWADLTAGSTVLLRAVNGQYVTADGPGGALVATAQTPTAPTRFTLVMAPGEPSALGHLASFGLRAPNGKLVCAEGGGGGILAANRDVMGPWETFVAVLHPEPADAVLTTGIRTISKVHFLQADSGGGAALSARGPWAREWETFDLVAADRGARGFVTGARVNVRTDSGHYLQAEGGGGGKVSAAGPWPREWETFTLVVIGRRPWLRPGGSFALRAANGRYVEAEAGGGGAVVATATTLTAAATFTATDRVEPPHQSQTLDVAAAAREDQTTSTAFTRLVPGLGSLRTTAPGVMVATFVSEARTAPGARLEVRVTVDGAVMNPGPCVLTDSTTYATRAYAAWTDVAPGYHTVDVEWRSSGGQVFARNRSLTVQVVGGA